MVIEATKTYHNFDSPSYICILGLQCHSWLYLVFFNGLWVVFPLWILVEGYNTLSAAMTQAEMVEIVNYLKKD